MRRKTLPRLAGSGWAHPYLTTPFSPFLYADGGDGGGSGSDSGDTGGTGDSGGSGDGGNGSDGGSGDGGGTGGDNGQGSGTGGTGKNGQGQGKDSDDPAATIKRLEKELAEARRDAGKARTDAKKQAADEAVKELTEKLGKALGLVKDDTPPDPKALADAIAKKDTTIAEKDSVIRAKDVELSVWARADKLGARAGALLDSRSFLATLADLDPSAKGFTTALDDAIKKAVKENPAFAAQTAGKSGGDLSGGTGEGAAKKRGGSLAGAIANHYQT